MGRVIVIGSVVVIIAVIIALLAVYFRRRKAKDDAQKFGWAVKGDLTAAQEKRLQDDLLEARNILRSIHSPASVLGDDPTILSDRHRQSIESWLKSQTKEGQK